MDHPFDRPDQPTRISVDRNLTEAMDRSLHDGAVVWYVALRMMEAGIINMVSNYGADYTADLLRVTLEHMEKGGLDYREGVFELTGLPPEPAA